MDKSLKLEIERVIKKPVPVNLDESDCIWWLTRLPEAKRYLGRKIAVCRHKIREMELSMEILEAKISSDVRNESGSITEKKKISEDRFTMHPEYKETYAEISNYNKLIEKYEYDIENVSDKLFSVRKIADFIKVHLMYEE